MSESATGEPPTLAVHISGRFAGVIERRRSRLRLVYDADYAGSGDAVPLSLSLPLQEGVVDDGRVDGWLDGLLPGNPRVRRRWAARHGAASENAFDLLSTPIGLDCPGAVQVCPIEDVGQIGTRRGGVDWLTGSQMVELVDGMVRDLLWERRASHYAFSLAGAQAKTALCRSEQENRWGEPWGATPSTHILKPSMRDLRDQAVNEHMCLVAARGCGLVAAASEALRIGGHSVIAVLRYDRLPGPRGVRRVHQEDMHQACGEPEVPIYQTDTGGHSIDRLARLIADHSLDRDADLNAFFDALAFNWVVCNTDAHSKNYSLLLGPDGVRLAPLYDIWSLLPYDPEMALSHSMAMAALPDRRFLAADDRRAWIATAEAVGIAPADGPEQAGAIAEAVPEAFERAADELPDGLRSSSLVAELVALIELRSIQCLNGLLRGRRRSG